MRDLGESGIGAGRCAEEVHENSFLKRCVLIHQNPHRFVLPQSAKNGSRSVPFFDEPVPGKLPPLLHQPVGGRIIERTDDHVHRLCHQPVREGTELPIPQVRGGEQNAVAGLFGL